LHPGGTALAFKPTASWVATPNDITHEKITEEAIKELIEDEHYIPGISRITPSMRKAIDRIKEGNVNTDLSSDFFVGEAHATEERFAGAQERLKGNFQRMMDYLSDSFFYNRPDNSREALGTSLHTIQDFYAHSNWVERGMINTNPVLGRPNQNFDPSSIAASNEATCIDCQKCSTCNRNNATSRLTSAFYGLYPTSTKPAGKCSHGAKAIQQSVPNPLFLIDPIHQPAFVTITVHPDTTEYSSAVGGISKDDFDCDDAPHADFHVLAARYAKKATKEYLVEVVKNASGMTTKKLDKLFGVNRGLAFSVDTTGSMGSSIAGVRQELINIVNSRRGTDLEPSKYVLMPFNDPSVGPLTVTEDPDQFIAAINGLYANGGDDCPELAQTGMLQALDALDEGSEMMMVTDASAKDDNLAGSVRALAESKDVKITTIATGSCSPIDPEYYRTASETGGQVFVISPYETANITKLADFVMRPNAIELLSITDAMSGLAKTYTVPMDSTMTRVTFSVSGTSNVSLKRPDGSTVQPTDANVSTASVSNGAIFSIVNPAQGNWTVTANGTGNLSVRVSGESLLDFSSFNFVEFAGGMSHEGWARISGSPIAHSPSMVTANISAQPVSAAQFELRGSDGTLLQPLSLAELPAPTELPEDLAGTPLSKKYFGQMTLPDSPFLVYAVGTDINGQRFQRLLPGVIKPRSLKVLAQPLSEVHPGQMTDYTFLVQNYGPTSVFQVSVTDERGYVKSVSPGFVRLGTNESKPINVRIQPPADAAIQTIDGLTLSAQDAKNPDASNSAVVKTRVAPVDPVQLGTVTATPVGGDGDAILEAGEDGSLTVQLTNQGGSPATNISTTIATLTPGVEIIAGESAYPDLAPSGSGLNSTPFTFKLSGDIACRQNINFMLLVRHEGSAGPTIYNFTVPTGPPVEPSGPPTTTSFSGPTAIIPHDAAGVDIPLQVSGLSGITSDLNFRLDSLDYGYIGSLEITLTSPQGTSVRLIDQTWDGASSFRGTLLDDEGGGPPIRGIGYYDAPYTGTYTPVNPLASFQGENPNGTWVLSIRDPYYSYYYSGVVNGFSLILSTVQPTGCDGVVIPPGNTADISVRHIATPEPVLSGSQVTLTTTVTNNGPGAADALQVSNNLPSGATLVSCTATNGGVCGGSGNNRVITFNSLPAGVSATINIVAVVKCDLANETVFTDTATASSSTPDPNPTNNSSTAMVRVSNPAPLISNASVSKAELWPANHKMVDVTVNYDLADNCGTPTSNLSIGSNEPINGGGDGNTSADWEVVNAHLVRLRAERSGNGNGRIYTITITATDSVGNPSNQTVTVKVPKSQGK
jgi:uncharacterized repeat protein (TIGR01451 family)